MTKGKSIHISYRLDEYRRTARICSPRLCPTRPQQSLRAGRGKQGSKEEPGPGMQGLPAMTWREGEELGEMVSRLKRENEMVRRNLEEAVKGKDKQADELLEISNENKALSKWGLENMRGKRRLTKELLEVKAGSKTRITALKDALQKKESHSDTAKGEVLKLLDQPKWSAAKEP